MEGITINIIDRRDGRWKHTTRLADSHVFQKWVALPVVLSAIPFFSAVFDVENDTYR
jgi:hypothetical protein